MPEVRHNLLEEPLLGVKLPGGERQELSLPEVLGRLGAAEKLEFIGLRPHQFHPWHAFLVQLGALSLHRAGKATLPKEERAWRESLLALTDGQKEPWCLVVEALCLPAFFQPPIPEETLDSFKKSTPCPDGIDVLITSKNHDLKTECMARPRPEHWIYSLVTLQTSGGYGGKGNYGISRMNGGFASRPCVAVAAEVSWPHRVARDIQVWLETREELVKSFEYTAQGSHALLWLLPWDGRDSLKLCECDPFYLEICRRVRLFFERGLLVARTAATAQSRIQAGDKKGDTGDIWSPVRKKDGACLTVGGGGFSYRLMQELLFSASYRPAPATRIRQEDGKEPVVVAEALVRGQGKTNGFRELLLPLPEKIKKRMRSSSGRTQLGKLAQRQVEAVAEVQTKVLHPALCALLQAGPEQLDLRDDRTQHWTRRLEEQVDRVFFEHLWEGIELPEQEAEHRWQCVVLDFAKGILDAAMKTAPLPSACRYSALASARGMFWGLARKNFPDAVMQTKEEQHVE